MPSTSAGPFRQLVPVAVAGPSALAAPAFRAASGFAVAVAVALGDPDWLIASTAPATGARMAPLDRAAPTMTGR